MPSDTEDSLPCLVKEKVEIQLTSDILETTVNSVDNCSDKETPEYVTEYFLAESEKDLEEFPSGSHDDRVTSAQQEPCPVSPMKKSRKPQRHTQKEFPCGECEFKCNRKFLLKKHMVMKHTAPEERPFKCDQCPYGTTDQGRLDEHMRRHTGERPFACSECDYSGSRKSDLKRHILVKHRTPEHRPFKCDQCPYGAVKRCDLVKHMKSHSGAATSGPSDADMLLSCTECDYSCKLNTQLVNHILMKHTAPENRPFKCFRCPYGTITKFHLEEHMLTHSEEMPYSCTECVYRCKRERDLKKHIVMKHKPPDHRPFQCTLCSFGTVKKFDLDRHMKIHAQDMPFSCSMCAYVCKREADLKVHTMKKHTPADKRRFTCNQCSFWAISMVQLDQHMRCHAEEKYLSCTECEYSCLQKSSLKMHVWRKHTVR